MRTIVIAEWGFLCSTNYNTSLIYCSLIFHSIYKKIKLESGKNSHLVPRLIKEHTKDCSDSHLRYLKRFHLISRLNLLSLFFWLLFLYLHYITEIPCPKEELINCHHIILKSSPVKICLDVVSNVLLYLRLYLNLLQCIRIVEKELDLWLQCHLCWTEHKGNLFSVCTCNCCVSVVASCCLPTTEQQHKCNIYKNQPFLQGLWSTFPKPCFTQPGYVARSLVWANTGHQVRWCYWCFCPAFIPFVC